MLIQIQIKSNNVVARVHSPAAPSFQYPSQAKRPESERRLPNQTVQILAFNRASYDTAGLCLD